jgi:site-specific DNA recombinase
MNLPITAPRVWTYARYSTEKQTPKSIADQQADCRRLCASQGWIIAEERSDEESSGFTNHRPGYQDLCRAIENRLVDIVVAENVDRIVRDSEHSAAFDKLCNYFDVSIHTVQDGRATSMTMGLKSLMSGELRKTIAHQVRRGLAGNIREGKSAGGKSYGYDLARDERGDRMKGKLIIVDDEAAVVRRIMTEYADGKTPRAIASDLNVDGIASPSGKEWKQNTINGNPLRGTGIINNQLYVGVRVWNRLEYRLHPLTQKRVSKLRPEEKWVIVDAADLRIVPDDLWDAVKARQFGLRSARKKVATSAQEASSRARRPKYLLSGFLHCARCGGKLTIAGTGKKRYYCQDAKEKGPSVCTGMIGVIQSNAEMAVLKGLKRDLLSTKMMNAFREAYGQQYERTTAMMGDDRKSLDRRLAKVGIEIKNLIGAVKAGMHSQSLRDELRAAENTEIELQRQIEAANRPATSLPHDLEERFAALVRDLEATLGQQEHVVMAKEVLETLVDKITVEENPDGGHLLNIEGNLAHTLNEETPGNAGRFSTAKSSLGLVAGA